MVISSTPSGSPVHPAAVDPARSVHPSSVADGQLPEVPRHHLLHAIRANTALSVDSHQSPPLSTTPTKMPTARPG